MSEATNCTHNCSTCSANCSSRKTEKSSFLVDLSEGSSVKKVIGVVSGKGGVGKSLVTSLMAQGIAICLSLQGDTGLIPGPGRFHMPWSN